MKMTPTFDLNLTSPSPTIILTLSSFSLSFLNLLPLPDENTKKISVLLIIYVFLIIADVSDEQMINKKFNI